MHIKVQTMRMKTKKEQGDEYNNVITFCYCSFVGYASGDVDLDAYSIRLW
jgi:hypothetical protein